MTIFLILKINYILLEKYSVYLIMLVICLETMLIAVECEKLRLIKLYEECNQLQQ